MLVGDGAQHWTGWPFSQVIPQLAGEIQVYCAVCLSVDGEKSGNRLDSEEVLEDRGLKSCLLPLGNAALH